MKKDSGTASRNPCKGQERGAYRSRTGESFRKNRRRRLISATSEFCTVGRREQVRGVEDMLAEAGA